MTFKWLSPFECEACGATRELTVVPYDSLGYPVCPECGAHTGPTRTAGGTSVERTG